MSDRTRVGPWPDRDDSPQPAFLAPGARGRRFTLIGMRRPQLRTIVGLLAAASVSCVAHPRGPTTMVSNTGQQRPLPRTELQVISAQAAAARGLEGRPISRDFGAGQDGTKLVAELLSDAEKQGAQAVGQIGITLIASHADGPMACRTDILPETISETRSIPASRRLVPVQRPVSRLVTEQQYRCHMVSEPHTRSVTESRQECHMVSHPVTRTRTTYSYQYDSFTHSSRSVPRTETYTAYESRNECRSVPHYTTRTENVMRSECRMEPMTHTVTRYEFQYETQYVPPRLETIAHHRLRESEPTCLALDPTGDRPATATNRIEATFYFPANAPARP